MLYRHAAAIGTCLGVLVSALLVAPSTARAIRASVLYPEHSGADDAIRLALVQGLLHVAAASVFAFAAARIAVLRCSPATLCLLGALVLVGALLLGSLPVYLATYTNLPHDVHLNISAAFRWSVLAGTIVALATSSAAGSRAGSLNGRTAQTPGGV